jgi:hypothetical protein
MNKKEKKWIHVHMQEEEKLNMRVKIIHWILCAIKHYFVYIACSRNKIYRKCSWKDVCSIRAHFHLVHILMNFFCSNFSCISIQNSLILLNALLFWQCYEHRKLHLFYSSSCFQKCVFATHKMCSSLAKEKRRKKYESTQIYCVIVTN